MVIRARRPWDRQDGSSTVELAVLGPVMIMVFLFIVGVGRIATARQAVESAAAQAARAASVARTQDVAQRDGKAAGEATLADKSLHCTNSDPVEVDDSQFGTPIGQRASVTATVTCEVDLSDVSGITGLPGKFTVTKTSTSPIDTHRGR